ncbi:hypothetical protein GF312_02140 [Candidatus Poribacteria bacterium]|nr:hypothetical protein [Candidatus Poribacteria bacterium]
MIKIYSIVFFTSLILALITVPIIRWISIRYNLLDKPSERKLHKKAVPAIGGIGVAFACLLSITISYFIFHSQINEPTQRFIGLIIGAVTICLLGVWDDLRSMNAPRKFSGQTVAVVIIISSGFLVRELKLPYLDIVNLGWLGGAIFTAFWITGIINTINFIDGMDGLAGGISVIIAISFFLIAIFVGNYYMAVVCIAVTGSVLGFLRYNFHPASIFMGDCGAMFLGLVLSVVSISLLFQNPSPINASSVVSVLIFGLPVFDTTWAIIRRVRRRLSPFHPDNLHTHNKLMYLGFSQPKSAFILYSVNILSATSGIFIASINSDLIAVILPIIMLAIALSGALYLNKEMKSRGLIKENWWL